LDKSLYYGLCGDAAAHSPLKDSLQHIHGPCEGLAIRISSLVAFRGIKNWQLASS
jgi:hypothetical protein